MVIFVRPLFFHEEDLGTFLVYKPKMAGDECDMKLVTMKRGGVRLGRHGCLPNPTPDGAG
jgi:hypothetical protein